MQHPRPEDRQLQRLAVAQRRDGAGLWDHPRICREHPWYVGPDLQHPGAQPLGHDGGAVVRAVSPERGGVSGLAGTKDKIAAFQVEDPREAILKYAKIAEEDPHFVTPAYANNQPQTLTGAHLAKTVDSDDEKDDDED